MKKLLLIAAMVAAPVWARETIPNFTIKPVLDCGDIYQLAENLKKDFGELPMMKFEKTETNGDVKIIIFLNMKTRTATIVEALENGASCIITEGEKMSVLPEGKNI
jgi:hypothetical protein